LDRTLSLLITLAWPVVTLAIALIFRQELKAALARVGQFKYGDLQVTFQQDLHEAEELAKSLPPPPPAPKGKDSIVLELSPARDQPFVRPLATFDAASREREALWKLAEHSPRKAIEKAGYRLSQALERRTDQPLSDAEARLVRILQDLSDHATRSDQKSPSNVQARRFVALACPLAMRIESRA
jgi:16S rRNA A1518/A1519 N6-dimethyltransferase RsmA/KsgA/DIM1 with predicted DNA glycosylase/AP lyase activity